MRAEEEAEARVGGGRGRRMGLELGPWGRRAGIRRGGGG